MHRPIALQATCLALLLAACGPQDAEPAPAPAPAAPVVDEHAGHGHAPGEHGAHPAHGTPAAQGAPAPAAPRALPEGVAAEVDGTPIPELVVEERFQELLAQQTGGQQLPPATVDQARRSMAPQILEQIVSEHLADAEVARLGIEITDAEVREQVELSVAKHLLDNDLSREDFAVQVREVQDVSIEEFVDAQVETPGGRRFVAHAAWVRKAWPGEVTVTDEDVRERYEAQRETRFAQPEKVRASHILLLPDPEDEEGLQKRAQELVELARAPDADFAALARVHSQGPSGPAGGDLGWFPREGAMVEEFAAAAFALEPGEVSGVVRTQFGLHVIKLTARKPARTLPLEEVADVVRYELETERVTAALNKHVEELRAKAEIKYP